MAPNSQTPLMDFFRSFPTFNYDPSLPPATSYAKLRRYRGWRRASAASCNSWNRYQDALKKELHIAGKGHIYIGHILSTMLLIFIVMINVMIVHKM
jgi:hypothetical protein